MTYLLLFLEFFKIGLLTFGGGYAMIPLIKEAVITHSWLSEEEFYDFIAVCESTPGPMAVNMATYIGSVQGGILGSFLATLGVVMPSFIIIIIIAVLLKKIIYNKWFQAFMNGVKPVIIGLILSTGIILLVKAIGYKSINNFTFDWRSLVVFVFIAILYYSVKSIFKKKINAIALILIASFLGIIVNLF